MRTLLIFLLFAATTQAQKALVLLGGQYPDGYDDTEVEVWSLDCGIRIKNTQQAFIDRPAVAALDNNINVCGVILNGLNGTSSACDTYSLADNAWTEGAPLKFNQSMGNNNNYVDYEGLRLTTIGSTLIAVYRKSPIYPDYFPTNFQISTLSESGWSEPIYLNISSGDITYNTNDVIAVDEMHIAITASSLPLDTARKNIYIVNVETANVVAEVSTSRDQCEHHFLFNNKYTCYYNSSVWSLSFDQDFTNYTWDLVLSSTPDFWLASFLADMDGMLTGVFSSQLSILYFLDGEWQSGELETPRAHVGHAVIPCNV